MKYPASSCMCLLGPAIQAVTDQFRLMTCNPSSSLQKSMFIGLHKTRCVDDIWLLILKHCTGRS